MPQHAPRACRNVRAQQKPRTAASRVPAGGFCWHSKVTPGAGYFLPRRRCAGKLLPELEPRSWGLVCDPDNPRVSVRTLMGRQGNELRWIAPLCPAALLLGAALEVDLREIRLRLSLFLGSGKHFSGRI